MTMTSVRPSQFLEAPNNELTTLPDGISKCSKLEVIDVSHNQLTTLLPLCPLEQLVSVHADSNEINTLQWLSFDKVERLRDLSVSNNNIEVRTCAYARRHATPRATPRRAAWATTSTLCPAAAVALRRRSPPPRTSAVRTVLPSADAHAGAA